MWFFKKRKSSREKDGLFYQTRMHEKENSVFVLGDMEGHGEVKKINSDF
jgi:hypothetical protein